MTQNELVALKKLLKKEQERRKRINELLLNPLIQEFSSLNNLNIQALPNEDRWLILQEILEKFQITESNGILVCTNSYFHDWRINYRETEHYSQEVSFDSEYVEYQFFNDIETGKIHVGYTEDYIRRMISEEHEYSRRSTVTPSEFCHDKYGRHLVSEILENHIVLNPYNSSKNCNGFYEVKKDFFETSIDEGQAKAKQLILEKYKRM